MTLSGEPDWCLLFWQWDFCKILARYDLNIMEGLGKQVESLNTMTFQCSLQSASFDLCAVVTGPNIFKFFKMAGDMSEFELQHSQILADDFV